jgi:hypothetical protein
MGKAEPGRWVSLCLGAFSCRPDHSRFPLKAIPIKPEDRSTHPTKKQFRQSPAIRFLLTSDLRCFCHLSFPQAQRSSPPSPRPSVPPSHFLTSLLPGITRRFEYGMANGDHNVVILTNERLTLISTYKLENKNDGACAFLLKNNCSLGASLINR